MRVKVLRSLNEIAVDQFGYFTTEQARRVGASNQALNSLLRTGAIVRASRGVYRVSALPTSPLGPYFAATLWPRGGGVLSHDTALELYELSDANPARIHITVPRRFRSRRHVPPSYVLHRADLRVDEVGRVEGVPVTRPARAIRDCLVERLAGPEILMQAISDGFLKGHLTRQEAANLRGMVAP